MWASSPEMDHRSCFRALAVGGGGYERGKILSRCVQDANAPGSKGIQMGSCGTIAGNIMSGSGSIHACYGRHSKIRDRCLRHDDILLHCMLNRATACGPSSWDRVQEQRERKRKRKKERSAQPFRNGTGAEDIRMFTNKNASSVVQLSGRVAFAWCLSPVYPSRRIVDNHENPFYHHFMIKEIKVTGFGLFAGPEKAEMATTW
jgi:hypothetical protein